MTCVILSIGSAGGGCPSVHGRAPSRGLGSMLWSLPLLGFKLYCDIDPKTGGKLLCQVLGARGARGWSSAPLHLSPLESSGEASVSMQ